MRFIPIFFLFLLFCGVFPPRSAAQESVGIPGRAPFAIFHPKFDCNSLIASLEGAGPIGIAVLWNTFGRDTGCLERFVRERRVRFFELHLINGPCIRNNRCGAYEPLFGFSFSRLESAIRKGDSAVRRRIESEAAAAAAAILPLLPKDTACYVNPILESNLSRRSSETVQEWVRPFFPSCTFVWNPMGERPGAPITGAGVSEAHGTKPEFVDGRCIANTDGDSFSTEAEWDRYLRRYSTCAAVLAWTPDDNCVSSPEFIDPRERSCASTANFGAAGAAVVRASR